jgi:hypothetical protein
MSDLVASGKKFEIVLKIREDPVRAALLNSNHAEKLDCKIK